MFYSKYKKPQIKTEINLIPVWAKASHAEEVRVDPTHAMRISDIMQRFAGGIDPRTVNNGMCDIDRDSSALSEDDYQQMKRMPNLMGANVTDINDYVDLEESFIQDCENRRQSVESMAELAGNGQVQSEGESESESGS